MIRKTLELCFLKFGIAGLTGYTFASMLASEYHLAVIISSLTGQLGVMALDYFMTLHTGNKS